MTYRRLISLLSLISGLVAFYLHLWKLGKAGALSCGGSFGCAYVQTSVYGWFLGFDVALIGTVGYALNLLVATVGALGGFADARWPTVALMALIWPAVAFTARLKYYEFVVLKGFCPWCMVSTVTIVLCAILVTLDWRRLNRAQ